MEEKRSWWWKNRVAIGVGAIVFAVVIALIIAAYRYGWSGTGFLNKSLWDWLQLLIIPLALAVIALVFQLANSRTERQIAKERYEQDQQIALDKQHEDLLQAYLDRMSELLLKEKLRASEYGDEIRNVARVRTLSVLRRLNNVRKVILLMFLYESDLIVAYEGRCILDMDGADLNGVDLRKVHLWKVDLCSANLSSANLSEAKLSGATLRNANLSNADLSEAVLDTVYGPVIDGKMVIKEVDMSRANLSGANLSNVKMRDVILKDANLTGANLKGAMIITFNKNNDMEIIGRRMTREELEKQTTLLKGATMPDGSIHP